MFFDTFSILCKRNGITPNKALVDCDISRTSVAKWKKGATPNGATLTKIADYFGVSTDYLLGAEDTKKGPADNDEANEMMREIYERPELKALFKTAKGVRADDIKMADEMLRRFSEGYRDD